MPTAESFQLTKIRPSTLVEQGIQEYELFRKLSSELQGGNTCIIGYNNISFDDHFVRFGMYRNLLPPYEHEHKRSNSRLDFLNIVRLTGALRPDGLEWPTVDGVPTFALGNLAEANNIAIDGAHDALADVKMTLELARKVKGAQPKLWKYAYTLRKQGTAKNLLDPEARQIVLHVSPKYGNERYCLAPVLPITRHPDIYTRVIVVDLGSNIEMLLSQSAEELKRRLFEHSESDEKKAPDERVNISVVALNQAPMVAVLKTLLPENVTRLNLDMTKVEKNSWKLLKARGLSKKLRAIFSHRQQEVKPQIAEEALYDKFIEDQDRTECANFWERLQKEESWVNASFEDRRLRELHARLKTKVAPKELSPTEQQEYYQFIKQQLVRSDRSVIDAHKSIEDLLKEKPNAEETLVLRELKDHLQRTSEQYGIKSGD